MFKAAESVGVLGPMHGSAYGTSEIYPLRTRVNKGNKRKGEILL